jgi:hypothetical protein
MLKRSFSLSLSHTHTLSLSLSLTLSLSPPQVNLGPTLNHAAYRRTIVKGCAHLARELVLNDGFSRMSQVPFRAQGWFKKPPNTQP